MNKKITFFAILLYLIAFNLPTKAQTFTGNGAVVPGNGSIVEIPLEVANVFPDKITPAYGLKTICINATHTWMADFNIKLVAPDGTETLLVDNIGGDQDGFVETCFESNAEYSIFESWYPFTGTFRPIGFMGNFNNGQNPNGIWKLVAYDVYPWADDGTITDWSINFAEDAGEPFVFSGTTLPIVQFFTNGQAIPDEPDVKITMTIIDKGNGQLNFPSDPANIYSGFANVELRGQSSLGFPKKSYGVETCNAEGQDSTVAILNFPEESDWVLHASYADKSIMRNVLAHHLFNEMGHYSPRTQYVELFVNGTYQGLYVLMEKIKRDKKRVDIAKLTPIDTAGADITGGYIIKVDKGDDGGWISKHESIVDDTYCYYQFVYPKKDELQPKQAEYIQAFIDSIEEGLFAKNFYNFSGVRYNEYIDMTSFTDNFIINEITKNVDAYRLSTFFHKHKITSCGKLSAGPLWDFDLSFRNADYCDGWNPNGWLYEQYCDYSYFAPPMFFYKMLDDTLFLNALRCRWEDLRTNKLHTDTLFAFIDQTAANIDEAQQRNYQLWQTWGKYVWPNPQPLANNYQEEIDALKAWLGKRLKWMDENMPGTAKNCDYYATLGCFEEEITGLPNTLNFEIGLNKSGACKIWPNILAKANLETINIETKSPITKILLSDFSGRIVLRQDFSTQNQPVSKYLHLPTKIQAGIYLASVIFVDGQSYQQKIVIN
ncbi:MAG: CotH kinase family protein [Sphingobacteriales bacterium]|nr:CotH kinase family protein [Sphingobacteriales bacterium]MBP9142280.1 CotH kinase family protein [Chitinophagales bacterium]MDA0198564.1 CotH kinase family protein [Bacteroidota bacterium]